MRRGLAILSATALLGALGVGLTGSASADPTGTCPDGHMQVPAEFVNNGEQKDHNDNGLVCAKPSTSDPFFTGGPDDRPDEFDPNSVIDDTV